MATIAKQQTVPTPNAERVHQPVPAPRRRPLWRTVSLILGVLLLVGIAAAATPLVNLKEWWKKPAQAPSGEQEPSAELVAGQPETLHLPFNVVQKLGVQTAQARAATEARTLELSGSLDFESKRLAKVRARFGGEVVDIAKIDVPAEEGLGVATITRPVDFGDRVSNGQLLAVVWNTDLGAKKSDLVDAVCQLRLDENKFKSVSDLYKEGGVSDIQVQAARHDVEADLNKINSIEQTLRTWRVPEEEIKEVRDEADRIMRERNKLNLQKSAVKTNPEKQKEWARVEVRAPFDGIVVEMNIAPHDMVDTSTDLFKVANMDKLAVRANVFEEDLPALLALRPEQRRWTVGLQADPSMRPLPGSIGVIGAVIDPNQHTALVKGLVDNPEGRLRVGQFISAKVNLPAPPDQVVVPANALVEDGSESIVFVQRSPDKFDYTQRRVAVARRTQDKVYIRSRVTPQEEKAGIRPLQPGELVVTAGAIELKAALADLQSTSKK